MYLNCSEEIRHQLNLRKAVGNDNSFYTWSATVVTFLKQRTLVVVNNKVPVGFILFGLTPSILSQLDRYIRDGMRRCLAQGYISPVRIHRYLARCGSHISYAGPINRSAAASLKEFIYNMNLLDGLTKDESPENTLFQSRLIGFINRNPQWSPKGNFVPMDRLRREFDLHIPDTEASSPADMVVLNVRLMGAPCVRQFQLPLNMPLGQLHQILQCAFEWLDYSYHEFHSLNDENLERLFPNAPCEEHITLAQMLSIAPTFHYIYKESQEWDLLVERAERLPDYSQTFPCCLAAFGNPIPAEERPNTIDGYIPRTAVPKTPREKSIIKLKCILEQEPIDLETLNLRLRLMERT